MGHDIGVSKSYYKPTEHEVMEDYLKAVPLLTINSDKLILQKQVEELTEKTKDNEYDIRAKLQETDGAYITLSDEVIKLMAEAEELKRFKTQS
jgi:hypothetical protein